jgi:hypothetical protein
LNERRNGSGNVQIFIQTDGEIIDVSKITHMKIGAGDRLTVFFAGGTKTALKSENAARLLESIHGLSRGPQRMVMAINTAGARHTGGTQ